MGIYENRWYDNNNKCGETNHKAINYPKIRFIFFMQTIFWFYLHDFYMLLKRHNSLSHLNILSVKFYK